MPNISYSEGDPRTRFGGQCRGGSPPEDRDPPIADPFDTMAEDHEEVLYRSALQQTQNRADAWDLVQEVFERALRRRPPIRDRKELRSWLMVVLRNLFVDRCRASHRRITLMDLDTLPAPDEEPPLPVWRTLGLDVVVALLPRLNGTLRDVFVLHVGGSSVPAIAARLGISVTQVSARLFRARRRLRAMLLAGERQDRGGTRDPGRAAPAPRSRPRLEYSSPRPAVAVPRPAAADFRQRRARGETANAAPSIGAREGRRGARHGRGTRDRREAAAD